MHRRLSSSPPCESRLELNTTRIPPLSSPSSSLTSLKLIGAATQELTGAKPSFQRYPVQWNRFVRQRVQPGCAVALSSSRTHPLRFGAELSPWASDLSQLQGFRFLNSDDNVCTSHVSNVPASSWPTTVVWQMLLFFPFCISCASKWPLLCWEQSTTQAGKISNAESFPMLSSPPPPVIAGAWCMITVSSLLIRFSSLWRLW